MMLWLDIKAALRSLASAKMRTGLTMLGIIIGVASIIVVLALGQGLTNKLNNQVKQLGDEVMTVRPGNTLRNKQGQITSYDFFAAVGTSTLDERDLATVQKTPGVAAAAPLMAITGSIGAKPTKPLPHHSHILATSPELEHTLNLSLRSGQFLDTAISDRTVVLGARLASKLLGADTAIGSKVYVRGQEFTVIGILKPTKQQPSIANIYDINDSAFITLHAGKGFNHGVAQIQQMNIRLDDPKNSPQVTATIQQSILANHGGQQDFTILQPNESLQLTDTIVRSLTNFTTAIASISLLVGGIGIMNIMLVSVTERTREIGIRKAVGATNSQILKQFLIEALLICLMGGFIGTLLAYAFAFGIGVILEFMPVITWQIVLVASGISTTVGLLFGIAPAFKASRKDPIEALRYLQ